LDRQRPVISSPLEAERLVDHPRCLRLRASEVVLRGSRLWAREKLADDTGVADDSARWSGITLVHNVASRDEVDDVIEQARANGGTIAREPAETFYGGYAGVFRDLDGHAWEFLSC
jgi:uncharacterized glyoxalase superfamily protein PhnB